MSENEVQGKPRKWVLATLTFSHLSQHFYVGVPILYQNIRTDLGLNYAEIGVMTGASSLLGGFLQMVYSVLGRRFPKRILLGLANLGISLGVFLMGIADKFIGLLLGNISAGAGQAGMHPLSTSIIAEKFGRKGVAGALSTFYGLGYIGNIVSPVMLSTIVVLTGSWRFSLFLLAVIPFITGLNALLYLRGEPASDRTLSKASGGGLLSDLKSSIRNRGAMFVVAAQSFIAGGTGMGVLVTWVPQFLRDAAKGLGLGVVEAGMIGSVATVGGVVGTIAVGHLADRLGHLRTAMACICSTIVMVFLLTTYSSFTLILVPHLFIIGVTTYSISSLLQAHLATISSSSQRDVLLGLYFTFGFGISSLWSTIMGRLIDLYSFNAVWTMMSSLGLVALFMLYNAYQCSPQKEQTMEIAEE